jgi:hypothetical protein
MIVLADQLSQSRPGMVRAPSLPVRSLWRQEAEVMCDIGKELRRRALSLPCGSGLRADLLEEAQDWLLQARMRGLPLDAAAPA